MNSSSRILIGFALTALVAGCAGAAPTADESSVTGDGTEAMTSSAQTTAVGSLAFEPVTQSDPTQAATEVATPVAGKAEALYPSSCVTRAKDATNPNVAHITFKDCTGPFGLLHLDGEEIATFSAGAGGVLHVAITGQDLTINGKPFTHSATADITVMGTTRNVVWQGSSTRIDDKGETVSHTSDLTISVDTTAGCRTSNGTAVTDVGAREIDSTITSYETCRNPDGEEACPSGTVKHTGKKSGESVTIVFDASDVAEVTGPEGHTWDVTLVCPAATTSTSGAM